MAAASVALVAGASVGTSTRSGAVTAVESITPSTIDRLAPAWTAHTGELAGGEGPTPSRQVPGFQSRPVLAGELLIVTTPSSRVIALDAETGDQRWRFDPQAGADTRCEQPHRGVAVHERATPAGDVERTIFSGTCDGRLAALDAVTGRPRQGFGQEGAIDLRPGADVRPGEPFAITSAPAIYRDLVITGALAPEGVSRGPSGDVRAFDVRSGREVWRFRTVPRPGKPGHDTWPADGWQRRTGVNVWSSMTVDEARGLVFLPIGSAAYDFYGGDRRGDNLYANSLVALDAATGERRWHYQIVRHDLWDYDLPAAPILADIEQAGRRVPAVVQLTKMGLVFVFDRETGEPVFGVEDRPVPASPVPGEAAAPTQPFPRKPPPLSRIAPLTRRDLTTVTETSARECAAMFDQVVSGGLYAPPGLDLTLWFPGTMGGATWSGGTIDSATGYLIVNTNEVGAIGRMTKEPPGAPLPYRRTSPWGGYARFWDRSELPCQQPPWGLLHAIDLAKGTIAWQVPLGHAPQLADRGITGTGTPNVGGAVAADGVVFIAATNDARIRAFDASNGREIWDRPLPASGHATPAVFHGPRSGRPFVVIPAGGGGRFSKPVSDAVVAFTLAPE